MKHIDAVTSAFIIIWTYAGKDNLLVSVDTTCFFCFSSRTGRN